MRTFFLPRLRSAFTSAALAFFFSATLAHTQPARTQVQPNFTDLAAHPEEQPAINSVVAQGIMRSASQAAFNPDAANTRGDLVLSMQKMFNLPAPREIVNFTDIPTTSPLYSAVQAVAPYLGRQLLCPGCALVSKFLPDSPVTNAETAVVLTRILIAQGKVVLVTPAAAETALANVSDANTLRGPVRAYIATAMQNGIIAPPAPNQLRPGAQTTRANTATILDSVQKKFSLPQVQP